MASEFGEFFAANLAASASSSDKKTSAGSSAASTTNTNALTKVDPYWSYQTAAMWTTATVAIVTTTLWYHWVAAEAAKQEQQQDQGTGGWWQTISCMIGLGNRRKAPLSSSHTLIVSLHRGACQCGAITFKLTPPRTVHVLQDHGHVGKLQYPTARVPSDQLHLTSGKNLWNSYHLESDDGHIWAFSFCKSCATQLLHATEADQTSLFVNVKCFEANNNVGNNNNNNNNNSRSDENSVGTKSSALSNVTSLPNFADPRLFAQPSMQSNMSDGSSANDSAPQAVKPMKKRSSRQKHRQYVSSSSSRSSSSRKQQRQHSRPTLVTYMEGDADMVGESPPSTSSSRKKKTSRSQPSSSSWNHPQREVLTYSRRVDAYSKMNARLNNTPPSPPIPRSVPSCFGQRQQQQYDYSDEPRVAPTVEWPLVDDDDDDDDDEDEEDLVRPHHNFHGVGAIVDDEDGSISSHSAGEGSKGFATTTTVSSGASSIDYNISASRESMLLHMRKNMKKHMS